jgi:hypothetical protein
MLLLAAGAAGAQVIPPFNFRVQQGQNVSSFSDGGTMTMAADAIGLPVTATVTVSYRGTQTVSINTSELTGSIDFSVSGMPDLSINLSPNQTFTFGVRYLPTTSNRTAARVAFNYTEAGRTSGVFGLNFTGTAPEFAFSYIPQGGNATPLTPGGTVFFPITGINTTSTTAVALLNRGSGSGVVNSITASAVPEFQLIGLPLPAAVVESGKELRFSVAFTPKQLLTARATLNVELPERRATFTLEGSGSGPQMTYETATENTFAAILPNQVIAVPDAVVGEKSTILVRFRNTGNADARITQIGIQGTGFTLSDLPFLPLTLTPGASATVTITFNPTQPGRTSGRLRIGDDTFDVSGNGLGANLVYSYTVGSTTTNVLNNGTVVLTPVAVGGATTARFLITNNGTAASTIGSIAVIGTGNVFTLSDTPALPVTLQPGQVAPVTVTFTPVAQGAASATLRVDTQSFTLSGTGNPPAALPQYRIEGASGAVQPMQQPAISLTLAENYPLTLNGTLTLTFSSDVFANDASVQFGPGGRTINFTIPANSRQAVFPNNQTQVRIQTGSVAGIITLTPSFATEGGINLTPPSASGLTLTVPPSAPQLLNVQVASRTTNSFTLLVTGLATGRSITRMEFQFTATADETIQNLRLTVSTESSFLAWYQSTASQAFGSQFTATVPFTLQGDVNKVTNLIETLQSVSVTLVNAQGTSPSRSVDLR